jgi:predicted RNase H-like HicB family nuclease
MKQKYLVIIEKGPESFGAYVPDLPGCVAAGATLDEVKRLIHEAVNLHLAEMRRTGQPIPVPTSVPEIVESDAA